MAARVSASAACPSFPIVTSDNAGSMSGAETSYFVDSEEGSVVFFETPQVFDRFRKGSVSREFPVAPEFLCHGALRSALRGMVTRQSGTDNQVFGDQPSRA